MTSHLRIMAVDDSLITHKKLENILQGLGHEVVHQCHTGEQAVEDYRQHEPDIVTMDITMPDMDGITATQKIIAKHPEALIIMVTSQGQEQMVMQAIEAGAKGYVLKPIHSEHLNKVINNVITRYGG